MPEKCNFCQNTKDLKNHDNATLCTSCIQKYHKKTLKCSLKCCITHNCDASCCGRNKERNK